MSNRSLLILSFITLVIIIAASVSSQKRAPQTVVETALLFPDLKNQINTVAQLGIESADGTVTISKQSDTWQIVESGNYPARFDKIKQTVLALAEMKILSAKTSNPSLFSELGVEDTTAENSASRLLTLKDTSGNALAAVIIGTSSGSGTYVRKQGANETWLASGTLDIANAVTGWIEQNLLNIADDRIFDTRIEHPDGSVLSVNRAKGDKDFTVLDVPTGKEAKSGYFVNQIGTILSKLMIENVKVREGFTFPDTATKTTVRTYDGLVATIMTANVDGANHISLDFSVDEALIATAATPVTPEQPAEKEAIVIGEPEKPAATPAVDVRKEVDDLNSSISNWVYTIPSAKYGLLVKLPTDVTQDKATEQTSTDKSATN